MHIHIDADDIQCATTTGVNVLISGGRAASRNAVARFIHRQSSGPQIPLIVVNDGRIDEAVSAASGRTSTAVRTLFIEDLTALDRHAQQELIQLFESDASRSADRDREVRLICGIGSDVMAHLTSSVFDTRLFYWLNTIHIALGDERPLSEGSTIH